MLAWHWTHWPDGPQIGVDVPAQSTLVRHCTQRALAVSQWGAAAGHCALVVHPGTHCADA